MGAVLARAGIETALYDVSEEQLEKAKAGAELAHGVLERLEAAQEDGGSLRFESDLATALEGADFVLEAVPSASSSSTRSFRSSRRMSPPTRSSPRTPRESRSRRSPTVTSTRARRRDALVEPAAPDPDDRGDPGRADVPGDGRRDLGARAPDRLPPGRRARGPGFVENRILYAILRECLDLVDRGIIDPEGLDLNVRWGIGYKLAVIGPMELLDMAGSTSTTPSART
jgi:3-hydroxybutyryl-CoA dehydrogenase/5-formyl-3-hydroxy-2-methylpyridine 4-carboxylate dehydrogenase